MEREWEEHMNDFDPEDILAIEIPGRTEEVFYQRIE